MIKLWLDDIRVPSEDWTWVKSVKDAKELLITGTVDFASLDHDLGFDCNDCWKWDGPDDTKLCDNSCKHFCHETGSDLVLWMAENNVWPKNKPRIHSANPVGSSYMQGVIDRYGPY